jgi:RHS repeat-associated protein
VIGEVDGAGNLVNSISYDAFGNIRSQTGTARSDFRFQGQWLESESGLYYFRARDYDPKSGLFLSRDKVNPIQQIPESANPYQFAYQNPNVYSDPSGLFSLLEINLSDTIQKSLDAAQRNAFNNARQEIIKKVQGLPAEFVQSAISRLSPFEPSFNDLLSDSSPARQGRRFENAFTLNLCSLLFGNYPSILNELWLQVPVFRDGDPAGNGFGCSVPIGLGASLAPGTRNGYRPARPDFIIKEGPPLDTDKNPKAFLIGDFTRQTSGVIRKLDPNDGQGQAILNYANPDPRKNHTSIPAALFVTFYGGSQADYEEIIRRSIPYGVFPFIASFLSQST